MRADLPAALASLCRGVTRVRVLEGGVSSGQAIGHEVLGEFEGEAAARLLDLLAIEQPSRASYCMCRGNYAIELWKGKKRRATLGLHHGSLLRAEGFWSDVKLRDGEALLRFLAERGVTDPLQDLLDTRAEGERAAAQRRAWIEAAPEVIRPRLPLLEGEGFMPRFLRPEDPDAADALAATRAALGPGAAAALLGWFGAGAGPWSGFPAYEAVAEVLLQIVGAEELIAAGARSDDGAVLLGLARFLGRHDAAPRERALVDDALRERLAALVARRCDDDARARFAAAMTPQPPRTQEGRRAGDAAFARTLDQLITCGDRLVARAGDRVVRFDPGEPRGAVLRALPSPHAELAPDGAAAVIAALINEGEVWRVPLDGAPAELLASGQERPLSPAVLESRAAWLEQARLPEHRTRTRVRLAGRAEPLDEHAGDAWDLLSCAGALFWARHGGSLWSQLFGKNIHRADLLRWHPGAPRAEVIAVLEGGDDGTSLPRLSTDGERIAWTSGDRVGLLDPRTGARSWFEVDPDARLLAVRPLGPDLLAAIGRKHDGELLRLAPDGRRRVLARFRRALWERERLVVIGDRVAWNSGEHLWEVDLGAAP